MSDAYTHTPVLAKQTVQFLTEGRTGKCRVIDGTLGCGGHSSLILQALPEAELLGIDRDADAIRRSAEKLSFAEDRVRIVRGNFSETVKLARENGWEKTDMILFDIGVSSPQIDDPARGFSFRTNGPLDMRMDRTSPKTAAMILNTCTEEALAEIFREYGELKEAKLLAKEVCEHRKTKLYATTKEFAETCKKVLKRGVRRGAPPSPTLCFQALRIEVNDELGELRKALEGAVDLLEKGGRLAVISFHSLEDRIVKNFFADMAVKCKCPPTFPVCVCGWKPKLKVLTKKPVTAEEEEIAMNPRSACAKLRVAERI